MASLKLSILTPEGAVLAEQVDSVVCPGLDGYFGVLANHSPMLAAIGAGALTVRTGEQHTYYAIVGGVLEVVRGSEVEILADFVKPATDVETAKTVAAAEADDLAKRLADAEVKAKA